jgi:hypothetical protein
MWPFISKEDKIIDDAIKKISYVIIEELKNRGLITLYLAGTILDKEERVKTSDIDFFAIVRSDFDMNLEKYMNDALAAERQTICNGFETRLRVFPLCSLQGGEVKGILTILRPERIVQRLPFFKVLWGRRFDYEKDFIKPLTLKDEAKFLIDQIENIIIDIKTGNEKFPIKDFPKFVVELVRVEAQMQHDFKYHPSRSRLTKHLSKEKNHIIHKAMTLRTQGATRESMRRFISETEKYIEFLKKQL